MGKDNKDIIKVQEEKEMKKKRSMKVLFWLCLASALIAIIDATTRSNRIVFDNKFVDFYRKYKRETIHFYRSLYPNYPSNPTERTENTPSDKKLEKTLKAMTARAG